MLRPATTTPTIRSLPIRVLARTTPAPRRPCLDSALPRAPFLRAVTLPNTVCSCSALSTLGPRKAASARIAPEFFSSRQPRPHTTDAKATITTPGASSTSELLPHRRRQARRNAAAAATAAASASTPARALTVEDISHPPDASALLASHADSLPKTSIRRRISAYLALSKPRLTMLVVLTAMTPYALYPIPSFLAPALAHPTTSIAVETAASNSSLLSPLTLFFLTTGTALCSASANSLNMLYEPFTDAKMSRTRNRPLVRNLVSRRGAVAFAVLTAGLGVSALYFGVNPTVSFLGASNIILYAGIYTPLKAITVANTWAGALVGGIPPLMGWAAAAGESATAGSWRELLFASDGGSLGGWLFASLLFAWQFPHFMALSWAIRDEYRAAGLRMLAWTNPARNARVALRYSLVFAPICVALCAAGVTEWSFAVTSAPVNAWLGWQAYRFWRHTGQAGSARGLFWASVWHLPAVMVLALVQKKGMWARVWRSVFGAEEDDGEWEDVYEDELVEFTPAASEKGS